MKKQRSAEKLTVIICASVLAAAALIVLWFVLYPSVMARRECRAMAENLAGIADSDTAEATVTDMTDYGLGIGETPEVHLEGDEARGFAKRLSDALASAKYRSRKDLAGGNWEMRVRVGDHEETLHEGDSIFYKSSTPHGMIAVDGADCTFLAMIMASTEEEQAIVVRPRAVEEVQPEQLLCSHFVQPVENEDGSLKELHFAHEDEFNFAFDIVDGIARRSPDKLAMLHVANDMTERRFTFKDMKDGSSQAANYFTSLGIKRGDRVMLVLKRHYQFWFAILGLHKLGAIAFVLVSVSLTDFYRVPWPVWRDMAEIYGRKYMTHAELSRYEVPATAGFIKFLHGIESEVLGKEATT